MQYQFPLEVAVNNDFRKTQSANKCRGGEPPNKMYQNFTHKNQSQPKVVNLFRNHPDRSNHYLKTSIDVHEIHKSKKSVTSHQRIKTEIDKPNESNNYPNEILMFLNKGEIQNSKLNALNNRIATNKGNRLKAVKVNQGREIYDCDHSKQSSQPDLQIQILRKSSNYLRNVNKGLSTPNKMDENPQINYYQLRNRRSNYTRSDDVTPLRRSVFQQIQDYSDTKLDQINMTKEEDIMQFSFGLQYNKLRVLKRFPKDIFYGDVRKAKKNLQML
ncbi:unnamed protein product (macronuclear) [Paramecium tetraurelia]|uniref:Uncharacterized protein n=1 Tax=Paramecium tetraurelia TaxID=5888 RepID=A0CSL1_PARTE|nr:uncharacterized protein GSPATT00010050001 [Paramecium tetraurelia]CAK73778.1 unnamed protein product [Paramecium tetraurelia]|eukprot:XP_001441175.1 hypothetical protein (macronuclear) [Paramecium tetraurelia strain d4-2]